MGRDWIFDIGSLFVLIGELEELRFRAVRNSIVEVLVAAPVAGVPGYLKSFGYIPDQSSLTYFSPYGNKWAPLRNMELDSIIRQFRLLRDGQFGVYRLKPPADKRCHILQFKHLILLWTAFTWLCFAGLMVLCRLPHSRTWIGVTNCAALTGWSVFLRATDLAMMKMRQHGSLSSVSESDDKDAIFILGRMSAGLIIEGTRKRVKAWTSSVLEYDDGTVSRALQTTARVGTLLILLLVFSTIPNGTTTDQLAFVLLNILAQVNVFVGLYLNAKNCLIQEFENTQTVEVSNRTQVYGYLLRHFKNLEDQGWIDKANILPDTKVWNEWKARVMLDANDTNDPKNIYNAILKEGLDK